MKRYISVLLIVSLAIISGNTVSTFADGYSDVQEATDENSSIESAIETHYELEYELESTEYEDDVDDSDVDDSDWSQLEEASFARALGSASEIEVGVRYDFILSEEDQKEDGSYQKVITFTPFAGGTYSLDFSGDIYIYVFENLSDYENRTNSLIEYTNEYWDELALNRGNTYYFLLYASGDPDHEDYTEFETSFKIYEEALESYYVKGSTQLISLNEVLEIGQNEEKWFLFTPQVTGNYEIVTEDDEYYWQRVYKGDKAYYFEEDVVPIGDNGKMECHFLEAGQSYVFFCEGSYDQEDRVKLQRIPEIVRIYNYKPVTTERLFGNFRNIYESGDYTVDIDYDGGTTDHIEDDYCFGLQACLLDQNGNVVDYENVQEGEYQEVLYYAQGEGSYTQASVVSNPYRVTYIKLTEERAAKIPEVQAGRNQVTFYGRRYNFYLFTPPASGEWSFVKENGYNYKVGMFSYELDDAINGETIPDYNTSRYRIMEKGKTYLLGLSRCFWTENKDETGTYVLTCGPEIKEISMSGQRTSFSMDETVTLKNGTITIQNSDGSQTIVEADNIINDADIYGHTISATVKNSQGQSFNLGEKLQSGTYTVTVRVGYKHYDDEHYSETISFKEVSYPITIEPAAVFGTPDFTLPSSIEAIEESAFENASMSVVYIPDTCTSIGKDAFKNCKNLTKIRIPENCSIHTSALDGCNDVYIFGTSGSSAEIFCNNHTNCTFIEK